MKSEWEGYDNSSNTKADVNN